MYGMTRPIIDGLIGVPTTLLRAIHRSRHQPSFADSMIAGCPRYSARSNVVIGRDTDDRYLILSTHVPYGYGWDVPYAYGFRMDPGDGIGRGLKLACDQQNRPGRSFGPTSVSIMGLWLQGLTLEYTSNSGRRGDSNPTSYTESVSIRKIS